MKEIETVIICKGHLYVPHERCLDCRIGNRNKKKICYHPVVLNRQYMDKTSYEDYSRGDKISEGLNTEREKTRNGDSCVANENKSPDTPIDYYDCGQSQFDNEGYYK